MAPTLTEDSFIQKPTVRPIHDFFAREGNLKWVLIWRKLCILTRLLSITAFSSTVTSQDFRLLAYVWPEIILTPSWIILDTPSSCVHLVYYCSMSSSNVYYLCPSISTYFLTINWFSIVSAVTKYALTKSETKLKI